MWFKARRAQRLIDSYHDERAPVADENMQLSRRAAEFLNPSSAHSLAVRNAVLALAPRHPFAKVLINTGRLSVAPNLRGSWLLTPDGDAWDTPVTPGNAAIDAPAGENGWLIEYLTGAFTLMVYAQDHDQLDAETIVALERLASDATPVESLMVLSRVGHGAGRIPTLHDRGGLHPQGATTSAPARPICFVPINMYARVGAPGPRIRCGPLCSVRLDDRWRIP